ncbi:MAG: CCA tRNA nucleotidyltransferase [Bacillota bacterium]|nr:CCA tRNA nucleotidyltransferase [Bacillota bacterium]
MLGKIPEYVKRVLEELNNQGFEGFLVGGCVRDFLLGRMPGDYDVATSALPEEIIECFKDYTVIETGLKHGTVTVVSDRSPVEVTTYRIDGKYLDNRRPSEVFFTESLEEDLSRRDFTINAMAYSDKIGIVDLFGGASDVQKKIIRCVGEPSKRFEEDGLRILRALRFSSCLGFDIDKETKEAIHLYKDLLYNISVERIYDEFTKLLLGDYADLVLNEFTDVIAVFIPELLNILEYDCFEHTLKVIKLCEKNKSLRYAALFHELGKPLSEAPERNNLNEKEECARSSEIAKKTLNNLHSDKKTLDTVKKLILKHGEIITPSRIKIKKMVRDSSFDFTRLLLMLQLASKTAFNDEPREKAIEKAIEILKEIEKDNLCLSLKQLKVSGKDIEALGTAGEKVGQILNYLLDQVIEEKVENEKGPLLELAKRLL